MYTSEILIAMWVGLTALWTLPVYLMSDDLFYRKLNTNLTLTQALYQSTLFIAAFGPAFSKGIGGLIGTALAVVPALVILDNIRGSGRHQHAKKNGGADRRYKNNQFSFDNSPSLRHRAESALDFFWMSLLLGAAIGLILGWLWFKSFTR